jgi:ribosome-associated protein
MLKIRTNLLISMAEFSFKFSRSSGPGGQNVNKVASKATLFWTFQDSSSISPAIKSRFEKAYGRRLAKDGTFNISSDRYRDQKRNMSDCLEKLKSLLDKVVDPPVRRKKTKPTRAAKEKRLRVKKEASERKRGRQKPDYE